MASFLNAALPSSDEEDDEYDPSKDKTGEAGDAVTRADAAAARRSKRPRCAAAIAYSVLVVEG